MRVCAPCTDEDGAHGGIIGEVLGEGEAHGGVLVGLEREAVVVGGGKDKGIDAGEGVEGLDVDCREEGWKLGVGGEEGEVKE